MIEWSKPASPCRQCLRQHCELPDTDCHPLGREEARISMQKLSQKSDPFTEKDGIFIEVRVVKVCHGDIPCNYHYRVYCRINV